MFFAKEISRISIATMERRSARIQRQHENEMAAYWAARIKEEHKAAKRKALVVELFYRDDIVPPSIKMAHKAAKERGQHERIENEVIIE